MKRMVWLSIAVALGVTVYSQDIKCQVLNLNTLIERKTVVKSLEDAANLLSYADGVPIGLILSADNTDRTKTITLKPGTIREVLDELVVEFPKYRWFEHNGVVNIVPSESIDPKIDIVLRGPALEFVERRVLSRDDLYHAVGSESLLSSSGKMGIALVSQWDYGNTMTNHTSYAHARLRHYDRHSIRS